MENYEFQMVQFIFVKGNQEAITFFKDCNTDFLGTDIFISLYGNGKFTNTNNEAQNIILFAFSSYEYLLTLQLTN